MSLHLERAFEDEIVADMVASGWLHDPDDGPRVNRELALYPRDLLAWVEETQSDAFEALTARHGANAGRALAERVRREIDRRGVLDVLRHGVDMTGARATIRLAEFRPAMGLNEAVMARYRANRLRVVRQVRYSTRNENALDLVLFVNGIPTATAELKSDFTQGLEDAERQYRTDRQPGSGARAEPMLGPNGAIVHFAVSNARVSMTTKLEGRDTRFLPFDRGTADGGAGNPTGEGHATAYLWREVWAPDSWLELIGRVVIPLKNEKGERTGRIFPRFHQLDAVRSLVGAVRSEGPGGRYLVQHSAGSGKTNSIAWSAHFLADLHSARGLPDDAKVFDTVIVVSDRRVIDGQLRGALHAFERTRGVIATVTGEGGAKSAELAEALGEGKKIVVCTIQTFPFALDEVRRLSAASGKRFAVIADEAHSSQTGQAAAKLREVLGGEFEASDGEAPDVEDILAHQMRARVGADSDALTYVAFTATPKNKTMELFGTLPDPARPAGEGNVPRPFHVYSMRQAIEEGFILDVLRNYLPYSYAFRLAQPEGAEEQEVDRSRASASLMRWVRLHPETIAEKVAVVVDHFRENVAPLLGGRAKAMVVVGSRLEAVRWKRAMDAHVLRAGHDLRALVAFSGEVDDARSGPDPHTERSMNPDMRRGRIEEAFDRDGYSIMIVADKFQTGFDQPLLCGMYVDRRLAGVQAVQTLSRLNRSHPGKDTTYVVDFPDSSAEVLEAFSQYHGEATLEAVSDPDQIFDLAQRLDGAGHYDAHEMDRVVRAELDQRSKPSDLAAAIQPVAERIVRQFNAAKTEDDREAMDALTLFRTNALTYLRFYAFLSQVVDYGVTHIAKREVFLRRLVPLLDFERERDAIDLSGVELAFHRLGGKDQPDMRLEAGGALAPITAVGSGSVRDPDRAALSEIIAAMNELFGDDTTDADKLGFIRATGERMMASDTLRAQAAGNTREQFESSPDLDRELVSAVIEARAGNRKLSDRTLRDTKAREQVLRMLLGIEDLYGRIREEAA